MTLHQIHRRLNYAWRSRRPIGIEFWRFEFLITTTKASKIAA